MKTKMLFRILAALNILLAILPLYAVHAAPIDMLQFTAGGHALGFTTRGMYAATGTHALHVDFLGANPVQPKTDTPASSDGKAAPLSWVTYANLWDGINLDYTAKAGGVYTTTYTIAPGADPTDIRLRYNASLTLNEDGTLRIAFETGAMTESAPVAWQEIGGKRVPVDVFFQVSGREVGFSIGAYNPHFALTIDPDLTWNTFLGGSGADWGYGIAVDGSGNIYVTGISNSSWGTPVRNYTQFDDAFAAKLDSTGSLIWNTFLGGNGMDAGYSITVDSSGNTYVAGASFISWGSPIRAHTSGYDAFAAKLDSEGNLTWNSFLGGNYGDTGFCIAVDGSGNVYVTGSSGATWGSPMRFYSQFDDAFVAKLDSGGSLTWHTFLGGNGMDTGRSITMDGSGNVYVTGISAVTWGSPVRVFAGDENAFVAKLDSGGSLIWNTFLGGTGRHRGFGIIVDGSGNVYVTGESDHTWGSPRRAYTNGYDAFTAKLDSTGNLIWNTFLGGDSSDSGQGIAMDGSGKVYIGGFSYATWGAPGQPHAGGGDAFIAKLDSSGNLGWNTFQGGSMTEVGVGIAVTPSGNAYVTGRCNGTWGSPERAFSEETDTFVAEVIPTPPGTFNKSSPVAASFAPTNPLLFWSISDGGSSGALSYEYCYDTSNNNTCDSSWVSTGSSTSATLNGLGNNEIYYWHVRATNIDGTTEANGGTWWSFTARNQTFADVPIDHPLWAYIEAFYNSGITTGCGVSPLIYCPEQQVTRASMAVFLLRAKHGSSYTPPAGTHIFADLPVAGKEWQEVWVNQFYSEGITTGCGTGPLIYCPENPVTRAAMAVFILRAKYGSSYTPPAASHFFSDLPVAGKEWMEPWVDELYREGITTGCGTGPLIYCPETAVKRQAMAAFIVRAFNLPLP